MIKSHVKKRKRKSQSNLDFKVMSWMFAIRDTFKDLMNKIKKANIKSGDFVLDYGCGPGSYSLAAAEVVGDSGKIFAADIHPLAIKKINRRASKRGLKNIYTILTDCDTNLDENSIDVVICFDALHAIENITSIIKEFHRVLKPNAILSVDDHHSKEDEIISKVRDNGVFELKEKKEKMFIFIKVSSKTKGGII